VTYFAENAPISAKSASTPLEMISDNDCILILEVQIPVKARRIPPSAFHPSVPFLTNQSPAK
jgi:hypothetical protein